MASVEKTIRKWRRIKEERYSEVEAVLVAQGFTLENATKGSHFVFRHPWITEFYRRFPQYFHQDFAPDGSLVIVQHNKKVRTWYLKRAADALEKLEEIRQIKESRGGGKS